VCSRVHGVGDLPFIFPLIEKGFPRVHGVGDLPLIFPLIEKGFPRINSCVSCAWLFFL
jgi:hypothetical protein